MGSYKGKTTVRALKKIDWEKVDQLLICGCNGKEIAATIGIHEQTLYDRCEVEKSTGWTAYLQEKQAIGDQILRAVQYQKAVKGSERMLIHLGEHRLKQVPKKEKDDTDEIRNARAHLNVVMHELKQLKAKNKEANDDTTTTTSPESSI